MILIVKVAKHLFIFGIWQVVNELQLEIGSEC